MPGPLLRRLLAVALVVSFAAAGCASETTAQGPAPGTTLDDASPAAEAAPGPAEPEDPNGDPVPDPAFAPSSEARPATVTRVPDGDSFDVVVDGAADEVRLIGVNANEGSECFGPEAGDALRDRIEGREILIDVARERDDFGRLLVYAYAGDELLNATLLREGFVVARDQSGHPRAEAFEELEARARAEGLGLWAPDACGAPTEGEVRVVDYEPNAPGPDNENPNGEFVEIANVGEVTVDVGGWVIKDESTRHRYQVAAGTVLEPGEGFVLFSGCGTETATEKFWCNVDDSVWNNNGDTIFVLDANGSTVDSVPYSG